MYPAAAMRERVALKDEIIPLSEGIFTTTGQRISQIHIRKGDQIMLALASYQRLNIFASMKFVFGLKGSSYFRLQSLWGDDTDSFNPYRWIDGKVHQGEAIGPYANLSAYYSISRYQH
jgi:hypothetical protein